MKVLKPGVDKLRTWKKVVVCNGKGCYVKNSKSDLVPCEAELEINYKDIFHARTGVTPYDTFYLIKCPDCGSYTGIVATDLPDYIKSYADKRTEQDIDNERGAASGSPAPGIHGKNDKTSGDYLDLE